MKNAFFLIAFGVSLVGERHLLAQVAPHRFSAITLLQDGTVGLTLEGTVSNRFKALFDLYVLETSGTLDDWVPLATLVRTNSDTNNLRFMDLGALGARQRYYRTPTNSFVTPFWQPTGPYAVGTLDRVLSDPSRTNRYGVKTNSSFYATFWYPALPRACMFAEPLMDAELGKAVTTRLNAFINGVGIMTNFSLGAFRGSPAATNQMAYPVLIYSCGGGVFRQDNSGLALELASHGYVVVSADHEDNTALRLPDGRIVPGNLPTDSVPTYQSRYQDAQVVLSELANMNATDPVVGGHLDLGRIGVVGWSTGGVNAAQLCMEETRIKAGVLLDPGSISYVPNLLKVGIGKPFLVITGVLSDGRQLFDKAAGAAYWLNITGSVHLNMGDLLLYFGAAKDRRIAQVLRAYALSFLDKSFFNDDDHLLDGPSDPYPEVKQILRK